VALAPGARLGAYEILSLLGSGGMGEVYRARDTKLEREVAIKILPELFVSDPERVARFQREAKTLAALNHPHIGSIYGLEDAEGVRALVLELVEGPTLADRIAQGPIPLDEALPIAQQMAQALEAAHDAGIIHRDLKPANIKLRPDGTVKVLDFGLAKAVEPTTASGPNVTQSPTITTPAMMTGVGMILGTAAYMSPEQAKGLPADKRSDMWAFGCVLYEMLTGQRAFEGEDVSDTLAAVLRGEPDWTVLPDDVPRHIRLLLRKCLEKDRTRRVADISTARFLITEPIAPSAAEGAPNTHSSGSGATRRWRRLIPPIASAMTAGVLVGASMWALRPSIPNEGITRFTFHLPDGQQFTNAGRKLVALSLDGTKTAYVANGRLYLKSVDRLDAMAIPGAEGGASGVTTPAFSPDGRWIAFWSGSDLALRKVPSTGGPPFTLCSTDNPLGISWAGDSILFASAAKGIMRVSANGGSPEVLVAANTDQVLAAPEMLPDGRTLLYTVAQRGTGRTGSDRWDKAQIVVQPIGSPQRSIVIDGGSDAHYVETGHLVYAVAAVLFAVPFDLTHMRKTGEPTPLVDDVRRASNGATSAADFGVSRTGVLMYVPGGKGDNRYDLALVDRKGTVEPLKLPPNPYMYPRVSPDGRKLAVTVDDGDNSDIWVYELSGASPATRLTFGGRNRFPVWTSDNTRIAFESDREGDRAVFWQRADTPGTAERLTRPKTGEVHIPTSWSPHDDVLLFTVVKGEENTMWTYSRLENKTSPFDDVRGSGPHPNGAFSPDGRWVAYTWTEAVGRAPQVFVQPFPATGTRLQVGPGLNAMWSRDGKELFFSGLTGDGGNFSGVSISTQRGLTVSSPAKWPRPGAIRLLPTLPRNYDVLPDAQHFVIVVNASDSGVSGAAGLRIEYVLNWFTELQQRVPKH
jgi:eukaryotic-like serine/threonine-protein kinase